MRIAITGGTGFVGRNVAHQLLSDGHEVVLIARGVGRGDDAAPALGTARWVRAGVGDRGLLEAALAGCDAVVHCAGINRELGDQTYTSVHIEGTRNVVNAARQAGVRKIVMLSFLRARPDCGSGYHESKFAAEEIVRNSGLDYTVLKAGVIYGRGDHMLDHLSHALFTFPVFPLVGMRDRPFRPVAVADVADICRAALTGARLVNQTVAVLGPDQLPLGDAVRRIARIIGRRRLFLPAPIWFHMLVGWCAERLMTIPLVSLAQVRILREGVVDPVGVDSELPDDLVPATPFDEASIRAGLPERGRFGPADLRPCVAMRSAVRRG